MLLNTGKCESFWRWFTVSVSFRAEKMVKGENECKSVWFPLKGWKRSSMCVCLCVYISRAAVDSSVKLVRDNKLWDLICSLRIRSKLHLSIFITDLKGKGTDLRKSKQMKMLTYVVIRCEHTQTNDIHVCVWKSTTAWHYWLSSLTYRELLFDMWTHVDVVFMCFDSKTTKM